MTKNKLQSRFLGRSNSNKSIPMARDQTALDSFEICFFDLGFICFLFFVICYFATKKGI